MNELFFELIRVSLGIQDRMSRVPTPKMWHSMYKMAEKQSLVGICFCGVQRLCDSDAEDYCGMTELQYLTWMGMAAEIQKRNQEMDEYTARSLTFFRAKGFPCVALKGQVIARLYGNLQDLRQSGDIDVWLASGREKIYQLSRDVLGNITGANYHHIHFPLCEGDSADSGQIPEIEVHIYPSFLSNPFKNRQLHKFCKLYEPSGLEPGTDTPSLAFDLVYIMIHCYRHLCGHGVGMRQVMDYYFVLKEASRSLSPEEKSGCVMWIKKLGLGRFAEALMWVIGYVFDADPNSPSFRSGLGDSFEPNEREGRFFLIEVMLTGNMGHGDARYRWGQNTPFRRFVAAQKRNLHLAIHYPQEVLWSPLFNIWRFFWLKTKGM